MLDCAEAQVCYQYMTYQKLVEQRYSSMKQDEVQSYVLFVVVIENRLPGGAC